MIIHECTVVNSVLYVKALVVPIVYSCRLKTTTKNIIIYERIIAVNVVQEAARVALAGRFTSQTFRTKWDGNAHTA